ncbi:hypothetical protein ULMS_07060 [Patiriisocius marinistellae]|uniref:C1q domain-containing protein n=1 Tax=Patiriisocius marinistellae TaxID=2494560 RepID=A0A5J4FVE1_9FLAO|nr:hypothetical protein [Patiriisocius marinistellae]GEQ85198.1 hypothetical protein ULMS_07060 [Patiriisocius marinistellae]
MKLVLNLIFALLIVTTSIAQNGINYKALIKDSNGDIFASQAITIQFQIFQGPITNVYQETHNLTTDINGIAKVDIGEGIVNNGNFLTIDWGIGDHFLNVQVDTGDGLVDLGTSGFGTVPYAKLAEKVKNPPVDIAGFALAKAYLTSFSSSSNPNKITYGTEVFDLTNNYDPLTSRFTSTVDGYYKISADASIRFVNGNIDETNLSLYIYKNGSFLKKSEVEFREDDRFKMTVKVSSIVHLIPGDYIEIFGSENGYAQSLPNRNTFEIEQIR